MIERAQDVADGVGTIAVTREDARRPSERLKAHAAPAAGRRKPTALERLVGQRRAQILETLRAAKTTTETAAATGIALSTASEHLNELAQARVVDRFRSGRFVYYVLSDGGRHLVDQFAAVGAGDVDAAVPNIAVRSELARPDGTAR